MSLFRLDTSIRTEGSASRAVADVAERTWRETHLEAPVIRRDLGVEPLPSSAWPLAVKAQWVEEANRSDAEREALALADGLVDELLEADAYLFATPLYNWGIAENLKTWIDLIFAAPKTKSVQGPLLAGRPGVLVVVRGGAYGPGTPREGWDYATPYLLRILGEVWGLDLRVVERELTLAGVNPALDAFIDLANEMHEKATSLAVDHGLHLAGVSAN